VEEAWVPTEDYTAQPRGFLHPAKCMLRLLAFQDTNSPVRLTSTLQYLIFKFQDAYTSVTLISTLQRTVVIFQGVNNFELIKLKKLK
jgi:hypothetical protein